MLVVRFLVLVGIILIVIRVSSYMKSLFLKQYLTIEMLLKATQGIFNVLIDFSFIISDTIFLRIKKLRARF